MSDNKEIEVRSARMDLVDADMSKFDVAESNLDEVIVNLKSLADVAESSTREAARLATAAQHPDSYDVLAKLLVAGAKVNREAALAVGAKMEVLVARKNGTAPPETDHDALPNETPSANRVIIATSTDVIEALRQTMEAAKKTKTIGDGDGS